MPFDYQMVTFEEIIKNDFFKWTQYFNKKRPLRRFSAAFFMGITPPLFFLFFLVIEGNGFFFSEVGVDLEEGGDYEGDGAARHDDDEEQAITHHVLEIA